MRDRRGRCRSPVGLRLCRRPLGLRGASQRPLDGGDPVELNPRQAAGEARGVVLLDEERVYVPGFCWRHEFGHELELLA